MEMIIYKNLWLLTVQAAFMSQDTALTTKEYDYVTIKYNSSGEVEWLVFITEVPTELSKFYLR